MKIEYGFDPELENESASAATPRPEKLFVVSVHRIRLTSSAGSGTYRRWNDASPMGVVDARNAPRDLPLTTIGALTKGVTVMSHHDNPDR